MYIFIIPTVRRRCKRNVKKYSAFSKKSTDNNLIVPNGNHKFIFPLEHVVNKTNKNIP